MKEENICCCKFGSRKGLSLKEKMKGDFEIVFTSTH